MHGAAAAEPQPLASPYNSVIKESIGLPRTRACLCSRYVATTASSTVNAGNAPAATASSPMYLPSAIGA